VLGGEIDIVGWQGGTLLFVEVRWRATRSHGGAAASIDWRKRARIARAAASYLQRLGQCPPCRIDALCRDACDPAGWQWIPGI
jgi:putative endonuclease